MQTNIFGCTMQLTFMYNIVLLYMLIFLVADCVCGVVGTSFLVVVGYMKTHGSVPSCSTYRLDRDVLYEDPCGGLGVQHEATRVAEDSIPTGDKPTIYDL